MGSYITVFSNEPQKCMYVAREGNSYVQVEIDFNKLVPTLELMWFSNHWQTYKHADKDIVCQKLLRKVAKKILKECGVSPLLTIEKTIHKLDRDFYLNYGFHVIKTRGNWCQVGVTLQDLLD